MRVAKIAMPAGAVVALAVVAVVWFVSRDALDRAEAGDCLTNEGNLIFPDMRVVGCGDSDAQFKVIRVYPDTKDPSLCEGLSDIGFNEELDRNRHRSDRQFVLCIDGIKK
ncbi:LppU/SCO3897 family protein [Streptomyces erythrochromogenes]|uniref:LppU/SCO3897 family protein n=1 Tax=Streptomyces erythrochromogenes TaxID=285574 RepID=UPI00381C5E96